eukprot:scaffold2980_cov236-Pinguiococcus_pyrenoidosus.AAC.3
MAPKELFSIPNAHDAAWQPNGSLCAVLCKTRGAHNVQVVDRYGAKAFDIDPEGADIVHVSWDAAGDLLGVVTAGQEGGKVRGSHETRRIPMNSTGKVDLIPLRVEKCQRPFRSLPH